LNFGEASFGLGFLCVLGCVEVGLSFKFKLKTEIMLGTEVRGGEEIERGSKLDGCGREEGWSRVCGFGWRLIFVLTIDRGQNWSRLA